MTRLLRAQEMRCVVQPKSTFLLVCICTFVCARAVSAQTSVSDNSGGATSLQQTLRRIQSGSGGGDGALPTSQDVSQMEQFVPAYVSSKRFMGSVLVALGHHVLLSKGYGFANLEWNVPNSP